MDPRSPIPFPSCDYQPAGVPAAPAQGLRPVSASNFTVSCRHLAHEQNRAEAARFLSPFAMQMAIVLAGSALMALFLWLTVERLAATERLLASCGV